MSLQRARLLLEELKAQDKRYVYAARKGICAGLYNHGGSREMFRKVEDRIRYENLRSKPNGAEATCEYFDLPPALESEVREFLNSL